MFNMPVAITILGIVFICMFRKNISSLLDRTRKAKGIEFDPCSSQEIKKVEQNQNREELSKIINKNATGIENKDLPEAIQEEIGRIELLISQSKTLEKRQDNEIQAALVQQLAISNFRLWFEGVYYTIFGSQIKLLQRLEEKNYSFRELQGYYEEAKNNIPELKSLNWEINEYLRFLITSNLIRMEQNEYFLTKNGKYFLSEIRRQSLRENKHL